VIQPSPPNAVIAPTKARYRHHHDDVAKRRSDDDDHRTVMTGNRSRRKNKQQQLLMQEEYRRRRRLLTLDRQTTKTQSNNDQRKSTATTTAPVSDAAIDSMSLVNSSMFQNNLGMYNGLGGGGAYNNMMMMGSYGYPGGAPLGPLSWVNQCLFGVQNVLFSISQAIQIIGMNTTTLHQVAEALQAMMRQAMHTYREHVALDARPGTTSDEERQRRRQRRWIRSALVSLALYTGYKLVRWLFARKQPLSLLLHRAPTTTTSAPNGHHWTNHHHNLHHREPPSPMPAYYGLAYSNNLYP
jgi:hypothetical protein